MGLIDPYFQILGGFFVFVFVLFCFFLFAKIMLIQPFLAKVYENLTEIFFVFCLFVFFFANDWKYLIFSQNFSQKKLKSFVLFLGGVTFATRKKKKYLKKLSRLTNRVSFFLFLFSFLFLSFFFF